MTKRQWTIVRRFWAGRSIDQLAREYGLQIVEDAIRKALR